MYAGRRRRSNDGSGGSVLGRMPALLVRYTPEPPKPTPAPRPLSAAHQRHAAMVADRLAGMSWPAIWAKHGGNQHPASALRMSKYVLGLPPEVFNRLGI